MFSKPFSFKGRIRRQEFGITIIIYFLALLIIQNIIDTSEGPMDFIILAFFIPLYWFLIAQGAKRSHDIGDSGWYQLIPFYIFWMLLSDSDHGANHYGPNPKGVGNEDTQ